MLYAYLVRTAEIPQNIIFVLFRKKTKGVFRCGFYVYSCNSNFTLSLVKRKDKSLQISITYINSKVKLRPKLL